jgi:hypothetical protein
MKLTGKLTKLGAIAAIAFSIAAAAVPASANTYRGDFDQHRPAHVVTVSVRHAPRIDHRREMLYRDLKMRESHEHYVHVRHVGHVDYRR